MTEFDLLRTFSSLRHVERQAIARKLGVNAADLAGPDGIKRQFRKIREMDGGLAKLEAEVHARLAEGGR